MINQILYTSVHLLLYLFYLFNNYLNKKRLKTWSDSNFNNLKNYLLEDWKSLLCKLFTELHFEFDIELIIKNKYK